MENDHLYIHLFQRALYSRQSGHAIFPYDTDFRAAPLIAAILISCGWGLWKVWKPSKTTIKIANSSTCVEVVFGDIFKQEDVRAIGVSEFFETQLGQPVSDKSLHGVFLKRHFSGYQDSIDRQIEEQLINEERTEVHNKLEGKTFCYHIGATANANENRYIRFALAKTNPANCKIYSDVELLWRALHKLWQRARVECNGHPLNLPLVGSGVSGLNLPTRDLLNLVILSAITESKAHEITKTIRIVLRRDRFEDIDLREVKHHWERKPMAYRSGTYIAFHADGNNIPGGKSDIDYYNLLRAWDANKNHEFKLVNSHEKTSAVRDDSKKSTLRASLLRTPSQFEEHSTHHWRHDALGYGLGAF